MLDIKEYFNLNDLYHFIPEVQQKRQEQRRGGGGGGSGSQGSDSPAEDKVAVDEDELSFQQYLKSKVQVGTPGEASSIGKDVRDVSFAASEGEIEKYDDKKVEFTDTLRIVGQEGDGEFLVIADQRGEKTILSLFSVNLMHWITVHIWDQRLDIVSATVSPNRQTVGISYRFTTTAQDDSAKQEEKQEKKEAEGEKETGATEEEKKEEQKEAVQTKTFYYSTFIQSIGVSQRYTLSENSTAPQKIQFLSEEAGKHTINYKFLHTIAGERIDVIGVTTDNSPPFSQTKKPWKAHKISGPHLWSGIFSCVGSSTNTLCVIEQRASKGGQPPEQQCIRVIPLGADKPLKAQAEYVVSELLNAGKANAAQENPVYGGLSLPYALNTPTKEASIAKPLPSVSALELPSGSRCVCVQHDFSEDATSARVTVVELESHLRMDYTVPIPTDKFLSPRNVRVMFDIFADYVVMYVPGHHMHFLDVSGHHDPALGIISSTASSPLPQTRSQTPQTPFITAFGLGPTLTTSSKKRHFLDVNTGIVYEYKIRKSFFVEACKTKDKYLQEALLHGAVTHLGDVRLAEEMMSAIVSKNPACATPQLFKEYILASTYVKHLISDQGQTSTGTPMTAHFLPSSLGTLEKLDVVGDARVSTFDGAQTDEKSGEAPQLVCKKLWRKMGYFLAGCDPAPLDDEDIDDNNVEDVTAKVTIHGDKALGVIGGLAGSLRDFYPKITDKRAADAALIYMKSQDAAVSDLFATMSIGMAQHKIRTRFCLLENFFCALDEIGCVCTPPGFWTEFGTLGHLCLPKTVFVQYIERRRMKITKNFVRRVLFTENTKKRSPRLAYYFLSKFTVKTAILLLNEAREKEVPDFLVERSFSEDFAYTLGADIEISEDYDNSRFLPISLLLGSVEEIVERERKIEPSFNPPLSEVVKKLDFDKMLASFKF